MTKEVHGKKLPTRKNRVTSKRERKEPRAGVSKPKHIDYRRGPLFSEQREGYTRRWVNDNYHNIDRALSKGWVPVVATDSEEADLETFSNCISTVVGRDGMRAILMEMPKDVYTDNEAAKQREVDDIEERLRGSAESIDIKRGKSA